jgi:hypothetical protein
MVTAGNRQVLAACALIAAVIVAPVGAQGKSGNAAGKSKRGSDAAAASAATVSPATAASSTSAPSTSANSVLYYGSWLDDASLMPPGAMWVGASTAYWKANTAHQVDAPVLMGGMGITPRVQVGGSVPVYHFRDDTGFAASGVGTVSMYGKVMLADVSAHRIGVAVAPLVEIAPGADDRFGWAFPVNVETRRGRARIYGSTGYFSRGSVFASGALELPAGPRTVVTGTIGQSHSNDSHQTSVGLTLSFFPAGTTGLFLSVAHSSAASTLNNGGLSLGGGVSVSLSPHPSRP